MIKDKLRDLSTFPVKTNFLVKHTGDIRKNDNERETILKNVLRTIQCPIIFTYPQPVAPETTTTGYASVFSIN